MVRREGAKFSQMVEINAPHPIAKVTPSSGGRPNLEWKSKERTIKNKKKGASGTQSLKL